MTMTVAASELKAGDYVVQARATVKDVQSLGSLVIVDFTDNTSTPPIPSNTAANIERSE